MLAWKWSASTLTLCPEASCIVLSPWHERQSVCACRVPGKAITRKIASAAASVSELKLTPVASVVRRSAFINATLPRGRNQLTRYATTSLAQILLQTLVEPGSSRTYRKSLRAEAVVFPPPHPAGSDVSAERKSSLSPNPIGPATGKSNRLTSARSSRIRRHP